MWRMMQCTTCQNDFIAKSKKAQFCVSCAKERYDTYQKKRRYSIKRYGASNVEKLLSINGVSRQQADVIVKRYGFKSLRELEGALHSTSYAQRTQTLKKILFAVIKEISGGLHIPHPLNNLSYLINGRLPEVATKKEIILIYNDRLRGVWA